MYVRLTNFFKNENQYGFQSKVFTSHAMIDVVTHSYDKINYGLFTGRLLVDLKKAFDTLSHKTVMLKLRYYGIRGVAFDLLNSYLSIRKQLCMYQ